MKIHDKVVKVNLVIELSPKEVYALSIGMSELYKLREVQNGNHMFRWPNTTTALVSHALTKFLNEKEKK